MHISQIFFSLQGEGPSSGIPAVFIRFPGCNLNCGGSGGDWVCDSIAQWTTSFEISAEGVWEKLQEVTGLSPMVLTNVLLCGALRIVYTGGEPLLPGNRSAMNEINMMLRLKGVASYKAEIETNGTIDPTGALDSIFPSGVDVQINCSPKLSSSGISYEKRTNIETLASLYAYAFRRLGAKIIFKFVTAKESDVNEAIDILREVELATNVSFAAIKRCTFFMPAGESREKILQESPKVWEWCMKHYVGFSSRLHILAFDRRIDV